MSRNVSDTFREAIFSQETGEAFLILLTINHPQLQVPIRVTSDAVETQSRGDKYEPFPFEIELPSQQQDQLSEVVLRIDNVSREITDTIRQIQTRPTITFEVVLGSDPNTVEVGPINFELKKANFNSLVIEGTLGQEDILNDSIPFHNFTPNNFPALF